MPPVRKNNQMDKCAKKQCLPPQQGALFLCLNTNKNLLNLLGLRLYFGKIPTFQMNSICPQLLSRIKKK